jgi:hypothetical protein
MKCVFSAGRKGCSALLEDLTLAPPSDEALAPLVLTPTLPVYLDLQVDRWVMAPGETNTLTLTVYSHAETQTEAMTLGLALPAGLQTAAGQSGQVAWQTPPLPNGERFSQVVSLAVDEAVLLGESAALRILASVSAPGFESLTSDALVGVAPASSLPAATLGEQGAVLRDPAGGVTLLAPAGAAPLGVTLHYTPLFQAEWAPQQPTPTVTPTVPVTPTDPVTPTAPAEPTPTATPSPSLTPTPLTATPTVTTTGVGTATPTVTATTEITPEVTPTATITASVAAVSSSAALTATSTLTASGALTTPATPTGDQDAAHALYLPAVRQALDAPDRAGVEAGSGLTATQTITAQTTISGLQPLAGEGLIAYQTWQFTALQASQPITQFQQPLLLLVEADWLIQAGVDPAGLHLWSRPDASAEWQIEPMAYDAGRRLYVAWLSHFSDFTIGDGLSARGELLPSLKEFSSDRFTGAATVSYPIETPKGLGGLSPNLSLNYASTTVDDYIQEGGDDDYRAQANFVGYGWHLAASIISTAPSAATPMRPPAITAWCWVASAATSTAAGTPATTSSWTPTISPRSRRSKTQPCKAGR